jgi:hypothetical protein
VTRSYTLDEKTLQRLYVVWANAAMAKLNGCPLNPVEVSAETKAIMRDHDNGVVRAYAHKLRAEGDERTVERIQQDQEDVYQESLREFLHQNPHHDD